MVLDQFERNINYLRVSVTDKCNLRCKYCMPADGIKLLKHEDILSLEEIYEVVYHAVKELGFQKVKLTGGEPLVRRNIIDLVEKMAQIAGLKDLGMTTNGLLLPQFAKDLKKAGLQRVNISMDTLDPDKYAEITRGGDILNVFRGIEAAKGAGLDPIKLNVVTIPGWNEDEKEDFFAFAKKHELGLRFIKKMTLADGEWEEVEGDSSGGNCKICNRLRLTCDGFLRPCLFSELQVSVREFGAVEAFNKVLNIKPQSGKINSQKLMHQIGG